MAVEGRQDLWSWKAGADLSGSQYRIVNLDGSGELQLAGAGEAGFVLVDDPALGHYGSVVVGGITKVKLGGTVAALAYVASNASGAAVTATTTQNIVGQVLDGGAADDVVTLRVVGGVLP